MLDHFEPCCVDEAVELQDMLGWVHAYSSNPEKPCRLIRRHPAASVWVDVLSKQRSIDSLTDAEVEGLAYLLKGTAKSKARQ